MSSTSTVVSYNTSNNNDYIFKHIIGTMNVPYGWIASDTLCCRLNFFVIFSISIDSLLKKNNNSTSQIFLYDHFASEMKHANISDVDGIGVRLVSGQPFSDGTQF